MVYLKQPAFCLTAFPAAESTRIVSKDQSSARITTQQIFALVSHVLNAHFFFMVKTSSLLYLHGIKIKHEILLLMYGDLIPLITFFHLPGVIYFYIKTVKPNQLHIRRYSGLPRLSSCSYPLKQSVQNKGMYAW